MPPEETAFHLDECLPPAVAGALRLVGYDISDPIAARVKGWGDEELIPWLSESNRVWITKDHDAKNAHMDSIIKNRISVVWVRGMDRKPSNKNKVGIRELHRMITDRIESIGYEISTAKTPRYYSLSIRSGIPQLKRLPESKVFSRPSRRVQRAR